MDLKSDQTLDPKPGLTSTLDDVVTSWKDSRSQQRAKRSAQPSASNVGSGNLLVRPSTPNDAGSGNWGGSTPNDAGSGHQWGFLGRRKLQRFGLGSFDDSAVGLGKVGQGTGVVFEDTDSILLPEILDGFKGRKLAAQCSSARPFEC